MPSRNLFIGLIFGALVAGIISFVIFRKQKELLHLSMQQQQEQIEQQSRLIESFRQSNYAHLMSNVLNKVDEDLRTNQDRTLSDETIGRIAALSYSLRSHMINEGDSTYLYLPSPERGQLLLMLIKMNIDTASLNKVMMQASFANAVLRDAHLEGAYLRGVDLRRADLKNANLQGAILKEADLSFANLWGAKLNNASLNGTEFRRSDLRWAELNSADLKYASLNGADLTSAQLRKSDLFGASIIWADATNALFNAANLDSTQLIGTNFSRANLSESKVRDAILLRANLTETILTGIDFSRSELNRVVVAEENWLSFLNGWNVTGTDEIKSKYKVIRDQSQYRLEKIEETSVKVKN